MVAEWIEPLAASGAGALVAAAATDAWQKARTSVVDLISRHRGDDRTVLVERALDDTAAQVAQCDPAERERQREHLVTGWRILLGDVLAEHSGGDERSDVAEELRALVDEVTSALPTARQHWVQNVTISGASVGQTVMGGTIVNHSPLK